MKLALIVLGMVPSLAWADAPCKHKPCGHVSWDLGAMMVRFRPEPIDAVANGSTGAVYHVTAAAGDERPIVATGAVLRSEIVFDNGLYFGSELDIAGIATGPRLAAEVSNRGVTSTTESSTGGMLMDAKSAVGWQHTAGSTVFEIELAPGMRSAHFTTHDLADRVAAPLEIWPLLEAQARVSQWLLPHVSVAAQVGTDLLRTHDVAGGLTIGLHRDRYR